MFSSKKCVTEALRRAKFKFPGRQKIHISKKWGFTKVHVDEFENVSEKRLILDGYGALFFPSVSAWPSPSPSENHCRKKFTGLPETSASYRLAREVGYNNKHQNVASQGL
ncbi:hypothetical protein Celaphus_00017685 [Cervus elaphus hippelaphus]|uniref:Ribosomal protein L10e/L16 domain-containing protein n=1 Tax=Cervus elaphus hippelaphus TaxID=46360 RepID=A0A212C6Y4_CEREH|nr:hypothetical protein Celaphus_00017685 [Cervus elaphus hippelaphus]